MLLITTSDLNRVFLHLWHFYQHSVHNDVGIP
jgi:hypothetical protein